LNPGTYTSNATVLVNKALTIQNAQSGTVQIQISGSVVGIQVAASNVTLAGFSLSGSNWGVYAGDGNTPPQQFSAIVLRNLSIASPAPSSNPGHGIYVRNVLNAVVDGCTLSNSQVNGIYIDGGSTGAVVINNAISTVVQADGIVVKDSNSALVAGNSITGAAVDGIILTGSSLGRIERNVITNPGVDGITVTNDGATLSSGNYIGRNIASASHPFPGAGIWLNSQSNGSLVFGNSTSGFPENGFDLFNSSYDELRGNVTWNNAQGGIFVYTNPTSTGPTPTNNVFDGNYAYSLPVNAGINMNNANNNIVLGNFIQGPAGANNAGGIFFQNTTGDQAYLNTLVGLGTGAYAYSTTSGSSYFLNRQLSAMQNFAFSPAGITFDGGASLGGNFWAGHNSTAPFGNIIYDQVGHMNGPYQDNHPYASDLLGQQASITPLLPSAGSFAAIGSRKTIEWHSTGCSYVDLQYNSGEFGPVSIVSNYPDVGYYSWVVPSVTPETDYSIVLSCKNGSQQAIGSPAYGPIFTIAKAGLELLSPQAHVRIAGGSNTLVSWKKMGPVGNVNVLYRATPGSFAVTLASNIAGDYAMVAVPPGATSQAGFLVQEAAAGGSSDSTDGFGVVMASTPVVSGPSGSVPVGTLQGLRWTSTAGSQYVDLTLVTQSGNSTLIQNLPDFGSFNFLVPGAIGSGISVQVTFKSSPTAVITTSSSGTFAIAAASGAAGPPTPVFVTPASGSGLTQTFTATYSDPSGGNTIALAYFMVNSAVTGTSSCFIQYTASNNTFQLLNDAGSAWSAPVSAGSGTASNGQCTLSGVGASAVASGNNLILNLPITFAAGYAGAKNVYLLAIDGSSQNSGWLQEGTWTVPSGTGGGVPPGAVPVCNAQGFPCVASLTPANGSGLTGTFTGVFTHSGGAGQHYLGYILFLPTPNIVQYTATGSCLVEYNRISNAMRLINDAGTDWLPGTIGLPVGQSGSLTNSHCTLNVGQSGAVINGTTMTVNAAMTFNSAFSGELATFMQGFDVTGAYTGMTQFGNWMASAGGQAPGPYVVGISPLSGAGSSTTLTFTAGHTSGVSSLSFVTLLISSVIVGGTPCQAFYFPAANVLNLVNDAGTAMVSANGIAPGTAGSLANSRCTINTGTASRTVSGNNVSVNLPMTFSTANFPGAKNVYVNAFDNFGFLSHWVTGASFTVQ
jgi:parallel beta-helix repeat protein